MVDVERTLCYPALPRVIHPPNFGKLSLSNIPFHWKLYSNAFPWWNKNIVLEVAKQNKIEEYGLGELGERAVDVHVSRSSHQGAVQECCDIIAEMRSRANSMEHTWTL